MRDHLLPAGQHVRGPGPWSPEFGSQTRGGCCRDSSQRVPAERSNRSIARSTNAGVGGEREREHGRIRKQGTDSRSPCPVSLSVVDITRQPGLTRLQAPTQPRGRVSVYRGSSWRRDWVRLQRPEPPPCQRHHFFGAKHPLLFCGPGPLAPLGCCQSKLPDLREN